MQNYFATLEENEFIEQASKLERRYRTACEQKGLRGTWGLLYAQAFGQDPKRIGWQNAGVQAVGDVDGIDSLRLHTSISRPMNRQAVILAMADRVGYQAVATNLDVQSEAQVPMVGKMLDYVVTEAKVDQCVFDAAEANQYFGMGGIHIQWDLNKGDLVPTTEQGKDPETGELLTDAEGEPYMVPAKKQSGAIRLTRVFPWQVARDVTLEESPWLIIYEPVSRYELAGMFPNHADDILKAPSPSAADFYELLGFNQALMTEDVVILKHFYHRNCKAVPGGRYVGYLDNIALWSRKCPVQDGSLPYTEISTMKYFGTALGHPEAAAVASQQEVFDDLLSAAVTNLVRYKDQPLFCDERIKFNGEMNLYQLPEGADAPKTADYQQLPESVKFMLEWLPQQMKQSLGLNDAAMGQPEGANMSGVAIASLTQTAVKLQRPTQLAIDTAYTDIGNIILDLLKNNATDGLVAEIAGHTDAPLVRFFTQQDLSGVRRVKMIRTSPLLGTIAGKLELWNAVKAEPVDQRRKVVEMFTGNSFEPLFEDDYSQTNLLRWENEELTGGRYVEPSVIDDPKIHVLCHRTQMDKIRMQPESPEKLAALKAFSDHITKHGELWARMDAVTAEALGIPLPTATQQAQAQTTSATPTLAPKTAEPHQNMPR